MIRLGLLTMATLVGLFVVLRVYGTDQPRADRRPAPAPVSAAQDAGAPPLTQPAAPLPAQAPDAVLPAASQTPEQVERFPGPALQPSPEYAGRTPDAADGATAPAEGPVLYVTASRVNMRAGPGTGNAVILGLDGGTAVQALGPTDAEWVQIRAPGGQQGYVSGQFLSPTAP